MSWRRRSVVVGGNTRPGLWGQTMGGLVTLFKESSWTLLFQDDGPHGNGKPCGQRGVGLAVSRWWPPWEQQAMLLTWWLFTIHTERTNQNFYKQKFHLAVWNDWQGGGWAVLMLLGGLCSAHGLRRQWWHLQWRLPAGKGPAMA